MGKSVPLGHQVSGNLSFGGITGVIETTGWKSRSLITGCTRREAGREHEKQQARLGFSKDFCSSASSTAVSGWWPVAAGPPTPATALSRLGPDGLSLSSAATVRDMGSAGVLFEVMK